jgi:hypothetical protein
MPDTRLILHVKGTEAETAEYPKEAVRSAISQGQLTHSQLIWIPEANTWKQVRELPHLLPSQKLAPAPPPRVIPKSIPSAAVIPDSPTAPVARVAAASATTPRVRVAVASGTPQVRVAGTSEGTPVVRAAGGTPVSASQVRPSKDLRVKDESGSHPIKWLCIGLGIFILLILGGNYLLIDQPLTSRMAQTPYSNVRLYAHFGAFMQPNVLVIHIPRSTNLTPDNLTDFLAAVARSTPQNPLNGNLFDRVALTSRWMAQYSFSGYNWKHLGDMEESTPADRQKFLIEQVADGGGTPLLSASTLDEAAQQARRDAVWETFSAGFVSQH